MRTTLDLPQDLLDEAMKITRTRTKTGAIVLALEELIRKSKISKLKNFKGRLTWLLIWMMSGAGNVGFSRHFCLGGIFQKWQ